MTDATYQLQSVERAISLLDVLADTGHARLSDLCQRMGANQTTILRTLRVLERHGLVRHSADGLSYRLGARLTELGLAALDQLDVRGEMRDLVTPLVRDERVTVHISLFRDGGVTVVDKLEISDSPVRYSAVGMRWPLHATAAGKAVIAAIAPNAPETLLPEPPPFQAYTPSTITELEALLYDVARAAARGYAMEREEFHVGFSCVAVAMQLGNEAYAVSLSAPAAPMRVLDRRGAKLRRLLDEFVDSTRALKSFS